LKTLARYILLLVLLLNFVQFLNAQQSKISYSSGGNTLSTVLEEISLEFKLKFAYDANTFQKIETNFNLKESTTEQFLQLLETNYSVKSKLIEGTWVLILKKPEIVDIIPEPNFEPPKLQLVTIAGYIKDAQTSEDLLYCNVSSVDYRGAMTNSLGFFSFDIPKTDSAQIFVSHLGYRKVDTLISIEKTVTIYLTPSEIIMDAIQVSSYEKQVLEAVQGSGKVGFNPLKATNIPRISNDDLANALLLIPGVNFFHGSSAGLSIRGSAPTDNLVLFDGIPVLETNHLLGNMSVLNSKYVHQAFVSRGGFDAEFGGRVAGMIELIGKSGKNNKPYIDVSANLLNTNILASVPITSKLSVTAAWRRSFIDQWKNYLSLRLIEDVSNENTAENVVTSTIFPTIEYQDLNAKLSFHPSDNIELNLNVLYGNDYQSRDFEIFRTKDYYRNELVKSETKGLSFNWNWQVNNQWFHSLSAGFSNLKKEIIDETGELEEVTETIENPGKGNEKGKGKGLVKTKEKTFTRFVYDIDNGNNSIEEYRVNWKTEYTKGIFRNQFGVGWTRNSFAYDFYANRTQSDFPVDSIVNSANQHLLNAFLQQHVQFNNQLNFRWGIRTNMDLNNRKLYWQPRGRIEFIPVKEVMFNFSTGIYHQFLSSVKRFDSESHFSPVWYLPNNEGVGIVKGNHQILGVKVKKNGWSVNAEGYLKNSNGKMNLFAEPTNIEGKQIVVYVPHKSKERNKGVDLFIQKKHGMFNHMLGYSLSKTEEQIEGVLNNKWIPGYNDRLHRLKLTEMVTWKNWTITGSWQFASGLPVTDVTSENSLQNNIRTNHFSQLDFALAKEIKIAHISINAGVSLLNIADRKNIVEVNFLRFTSDTESLTVRSDISALGFTPVFFVNFKIQ